VAPEALVTISVTFKIYFSQTGINSFINAGLPISSVSFFVLEGEVVPLPVNPLHTMEPIRTREEVSSARYPQLPELHNLPSGASLSGSLTHYFNWNREQTCMKCDLSASRSEIM
jgi:hypothetical protein